MRGDCRVCVAETDCLVLVGHSIERGPDGQWHLTRLLQTVRELGVAPDGFRRFVRTARRDRVGNNDESAYVGGGLIAALAAVEIYTQLAQKGVHPQVVVHCAGRPGYLDVAAPDDPTISEAKPMYEFFTAQVDKRELQLPKQFLVEYGLNTEHDIRNGLEVAVQRGLKNVTFVALGVRLPRMQEFTNKAKTESRYQDMNVNFIPAENVVRAYCVKKGRGGQWGHVWESFINSGGYKRTQSAEFGGIKASQAGTYGQAIGGIGGT